MKELLQKYRIGSKLLALVIAVALWAVVLEVNNPTREVDITGVPVEFLNQTKLLQSQNLVVSEIGNETVNITVTGTFENIRNVTIDNVKVYADVSSYTEPGEYLLRYVISLPDGATVKSRSPSTIPIVVEEIVEKELPVQLVYEGKLPEGVILEEAKLDRTMVRVSGTASEMEKAKTALIRLDAGRLSSDYAADCTYEIVDAENNVLTSPYNKHIDSTVFVEIEAYLTKTVPLEVTVSASSGVAKASVQVKCYPNEVTIYGRAADLQKIKSLNIGVINVRDFITEYETTFRIELPEGVTFYEDVVEEAAVHVNLLDVETKQIEIDNILLSNIPDGMDELVVLETETLDILVRCDRNKLKAIDPENFKAFVDLSEVNLSVGRHIVPVQVKSGVGGYDICGDYSVVVEVIAAEADAEDGQSSEER